MIYFKSSGIGLFRWSELEGKKVGRNLDFGQGWGKTLFLIKTRVLTKHINSYPP